MTQHICSLTTERCPKCGHVDSRDAFEGWTDSGWYVCCPACEHELEDQSDWDDRDCDACREHSLLTEGDA